MDGAVVRPMRLDEVGFCDDRAEIGRPHPLSFEPPITRWGMERPR